MKKALLFLCFLMIVGCGSRRIVLKTEIPHLVTPPLECVRPPIDLRYKIERDSEWFCMDAPSIGSLRDYINCMEASTAFCIHQIEQYEKYRVESSK